jgi:O-antigen/teichoic acid export membrane protein
LAAGATWLMAGKTIAFAATLALPLVLARRLSLIEYGNYKQLFLLLQSSLSFLPVGMGMSAFYFLPRARDSQEKGHIVFCILLFYLATTGAVCLVLLLDPGLVGSLLHSPELGREGRLIGVAIVLFILLASGESFLSAILIVVSNTLRTALLLAAALIWGNVKAIIYATVLFSAAQFGVLLFYLERRYPGFWRVFDPGLIKSQLSYAVPLGMAALLAAMQTDVHNYFVSHYFDPAVFAIYATGCFQLPLVSILSDSVGYVVVPRISALQFIDDTPEIVRLTARVMRSLSVVYLPMFTFLLVMAPEFITLLFSRRFLPSVPIFRINLLFLPLSILMLDPIVRAHKEQRYWILRLNIFAIFSLSAVLFFGIRQFGLTGTILCVVISQYLVRFMILARVARFLHLRWRDLTRLGDILWIAIASVAAAAVAFALKTTIPNQKPFFALLLDGTAFVAVYVALLFAFKVPAASELATARAKVSKVTALFVRKRQPTP